MTEYISFEKYSYLMNRVAFWLVNTKAQFKKQNVYSIGNRQADLGTIENELLKRGTNYQTDKLMNEFVECAIYDNRNNLDFLPNYVSDEKGNKYNKNVFVNMANYVSKYEVEHNGVSPSSVPVDNSPLKQEVVVDNSGCGNPYTQKPLLTSTGVAGMGQGTPYYCACNSVQQVLYELTGINVSESTLAGVMGTTTAGTGHAGIETGIAWFNRKYGYNLKVEWKSFSGLGSTNSARFKALGELMCPSNRAVFTHLLYRNQYGHYEVPQKINTNTGIITVLNSLGNRCGNGYYGYVENRSFGTEASYIAGISQKGICVVSK